MMFCNDMFACIRKLGEKINDQPLNQQKKEKTMFLKNDYE